MVDIRPLLEEFRDSGPRLCRPSIQVSAFGQFRTNPRPQNQSRAVLGSARRRRTDLGLARAGLGLVGSDNLVLGVGKDDGREDANSAGNDARETHFE